MPKRKNKGFKVHWPKRKDKMEKPIVIDKLINSGELGINLITDEECWALYHKYVWWYARYTQRNFKLTEEDVEDLVSECKIYLLKCPQTQRHYAPYVKTIVNNTTRGWLVKNVKPRANFVSLDALLDDNTYGGDDAGTSTSKSWKNDTEIERILTDPRKLVEQELIESDFMRAFWQQTDGTEQLLVIYVLGLDGHKPRTYLSAGKLMGISKEKAKIIYENAIDRIRLSLK